MRPSLLVTIGILLMALAASWSTTSFGICLPNKELVVANDDVMDTLVASTPTYDPCDNWMAWEDRFTVDNRDYDYNLNFVYYGTEVHHSYNNWLYTPDVDYVLHDKEYVGPSSSHRLALTKGSIIARGCFRDISMKATYSADDPTKR